MNIETLINQPINKKLPKRKGTIVACLECNKNHKKCDGGRPCSYCVKRNVSCTENQKRKKVGRPRLTEEEKMMKKSEKTVSQTPNPILLQIKCFACNALQDTSAKFCNQCGAKTNTLEEKNQLLMKEVEELKLKVLSLQKMVEIKEQNHSQFWMLHRLNIPNDDKIHMPCPSIIEEASPSVLELLGYHSLNKVVFPSLFPNDHVIAVDKSKLAIELMAVPNLLKPRVLVKSNNVYLRHSQGHYVLVNMRLHGFFDGNKTPSFGFSLIDSILDRFVEPQNIPNYPQPIEFKFMFNPLDAPPEKLIKFGLSKNHFHRDPSQQSPRTKQTTKQSHGTSSTVEPTYSGSCTITLKDLEENLFTIF